jgi:hypothetical protein
VSYPGKLRRASGLRLGKGGEIVAAKKSEKMKAALDKKDEAQFERAMYEALSQDTEDVHFNVAPEDNVPLQVFNQVLQKQAKRKVN